MSDYPMLISNKLHSFRNFLVQIYLYFCDSKEIPYRKFIEAGQDQKTDPLPQSGFMAYRKKREIRKS